VTDEVRTVTPEAKVTGILRLNLRINLYGNVENETAKSLPRCKVASLRRAL